MSARRKLLAIDDPLEVSRPLAPPAPPAAVPPAPEAVVERRALFVRLQIDEADAVARAAFELRVTKQDLIGALVQRHVDASSPEGLAALRELLRQVRR
jgi:hypothetical protein